MIGELSHQEFADASGISISVNYYNRVYHVNDGEQGRWVIATNLKGTFLGKFKIQQFEDPMMDVEDMDLALCTGSKTDSCLYVADIGDNKSQRSFIKIAVVHEPREMNKKSIEPIRVLRFKYPDGAHDAEAFAIHPNGDAYIMTKELDYTNHVASAARLYRIPKKKMRNNLGTVEVMEHVGDFELPYVLFDFNLWGNLVTSMDFSPSGDTLLLLTYGAVVGVKFYPNLKPVREWSYGYDYRIYATPYSPQQEALGCTLLMAQVLS